MSKQKFFSMLASEVDRLDKTGSAKRGERVIDGFEGSAAMIDGAKYLVFNSNDYLGLRHLEELKVAEKEATEKFGTGPGAVRFISGTLEPHKDLEASIAKFHGRGDAIVFSSAFAANTAALFSLIKPQSRDSLLNPKVLVLSDELNHRSIIDGIRLANLDRSQKQVFAHLDHKDLESKLKTGVGQFDRVIVATDGVFSMLGETQKLTDLQLVIDKYDDLYPEGVITFVDDCHGIGAIGETGRGVEELEGVKADVLVGTLGKAFGCDGGYVTGSRELVDYLRESAATYIYSNSISPGTAAAAKAAIELVSSGKGQDLLLELKDRIELFKKLAKENKIELAADSIHPVQPVLVGDTKKANELSEFLFENCILATKIAYPVVAKGRDEIRVQISASHSKDEIEKLIEVLTRFGD